MASLFDPYFSKETVSILNNGNPNVSQNSTVTEMAKDEQVATNEISNAKKVHQLTEQLDNLTNKLKNIEEQISKLPEKEEMTDEQILDLGYQVGSVDAATNYINTRNGRLTREQAAKDREKAMEESNKTNANMKESNKNEAKSKLMAINKDMEDAKRLYNKNKSSQDADQYKADYEEAIKIFNKANDEFTNTFGSSNYENVSLDKLKSSDNDSKDTKELDDTTTLKIEDSKRSIASLNPTQRKEYEITLKKILDGNGTDTDKQNEISSLSLKAEKQKTANDKADRDRVSKATKIKEEAIPSLTNLENRIKAAVKLQKVTNVNGLNDASISRLKDKIDVYEARYGNVYPISNSNLVSSVKNIKR